MFPLVREAIETRRSFTVDLLYGDYEGGQRMISRFSIQPTSDGSGWMAIGSRHWNLDRPQPR
jgi:hypothetical protein